MTLAATLLLSVIPQVFPGGDLKLPPKTPVQEQPTDVRPLSEIERFRRDLLDMNGPQVKVDAKLDEMGQAYPKIELLILEVARTAPPSEMIHLMPVARRFGRISGTDRVADELLFQLLGRSLGKSTRVVIETMAELKGGEARAALRQCLRARTPAVRRQAVMVYADIAGAEDVEFAMQLSREQSLDLQLRGLDLLQAIGSPEAVERMIQLLSKQPALAAAACDALTKVGDVAAGALQQRLQQPAIDRSFVYAAFALAQIGALSGRELLPDECYEPLKKRLQAPEPLTRCLAAVPLADLCYRGVDGAAADHPDREIVDALLLVVEPKSFVPNLDLLRAPSEERLQRHTGRVVTSGEPLPWRSWWQTQRDTFLGVRAHVVVDEQNCGGAIVVLRQNDRVVRVLGEDMADLEPRDGALEVLLTSAEMLAFVRELEADGFGNQVAMHVDSALPRVRSLELQVPGGRTSVSVTDRPHFTFDNLVGLIQRQIDEQLWQLYRNPEDEPNRAAFWRAERRWLQANPDPVARAQRFVTRLVKGWPQWGGEERARGVAFLLSHPDRKQVLTEQHGELALASLRARGGALEPVDQQLLEIAASAPGDRVWRACVEFAVAAGEDSTAAVRGVFQVLGDDAVLSALGDENAVVRRAAIDEVVRIRDQRAAPRLIAMLEDEDYSVQRGAAFACGHLRVRAASKPLVARITDAATPVELYRDCLRALGRVGGELAFPVLQRAVTSQVEEDKQAALRGLGELRDPRAAHLLAEFAVIGKGQPIGELAKYHLQRLGAELAVPALRGQLPLVRDEETRAELVMMLGLYQDRRTVPDLMDLLRQERHAREATALLEGATGADLTNVPDRITAIETWWSKNKSGAQWQWLIAALDELEIPTSLDAGQFVAEADQVAVPELCRLLEELRVPRLWVLTSAVLRDVAGEDFGEVTQQTPPEVRAGIAARYRVRAESARAAKKQ